MKNKHDLRNFVEWSNGYIGQCRCCQTINIAFKNSLFIIQLDQFDDFCQLFRASNYLTPFYTTHEKEMILHTPMPSYFLLFSHDEIDELVEKLAEASPLIEAHAILNALANQ